MDKLNDKENNFEARFLMKRNVRRLGILCSVFIGLNACGQTRTANVENNAKAVAAKDTMQYKVAIAPVESGTKSETALNKQAAGEHKKSEFRPGVTVNFAYDQPLGSVYSSSWWISLDKRNDSWIDAYYETNEKSSISGILSFNCDRAADVGVVDYGSDWGNANSKTLYIVKSSMLSDWQRESQNESWPNTLPPVPYQVYASARKKYC
jgi:hypothetical protein